MVLVEATNTSWAFWGVPSSGEWRAPIRLGAQRAAGAAGASARVAEVPVGPDLGLFAKKRAFFLSFF